MDDDMLIIEDLDVGDESEVRRIISNVESLASVKGFGLRVSFLTTEQWQTLIKRSMSNTFKRGAELYINLVRDPRDHHHLLVSPSAVKGVNEGSVSIYQEIIYTTLRCLPTQLSASLAHGVDDILAKSIADDLGVNIFIKNYPQESILIEGMMNALSKEFKHRMIDWAVVFRRSPNSVFRAIEKSKTFKSLDEQAIEEIQKDPIDWQSQYVKDILSLTENNA